MIRPNSMSSTHTSELKQLYQAHYPALHLKMCVANVCEKTKCTASLIFG